MSRLYEAIAEVNIRREPKIVEVKVGKNFVTNRVGSINPGTQRIIYSTITDKDNSTWGRVSQADSTGIAEWVCIQNTNRVFMKAIIEQEFPIRTLTAWANEIDAWARSEGYQGIKP
jgi:hypothetical protein